MLQEHLSTCAIVPVPAMDLAGLDLDLGLYCSALAGGHWTVSELICPDWI